MSKEKRIHIRTWSQIRYSHLAHGCVMNTGLIKNYNLTWWLGPHSNISWRRTQDGLCQCIRAPVGSTYFVKSHWFGISEAAGSAYKTHDPHQNICKNSCNWWIGFKKAFTPHKLPSEMWSVKVFAKLNACSEEYFKYTTYSESAWPCNWDKTTKYHSLNFLCQMDLLNMNQYFIYNCGWTNG